ncbi:MAG TPA: hypothetical protein VMT00_08840 [Thermoanaerobaculia bacterium]|nr:hypothetical protein [Thermoanaerobaculia bacterium]
MEQSKAKEWSARRILIELCDSDKRRAILTSFWKNASEHDRLMPAMQLAKALHFRDETIRKAPAAKKAEWLASRITSPMFEQVLETALMIHHTTEAREMLGAFLDAWEIPHTNGTIEGDEYRVPAEDDVRRAAAALGERFSPQDIRIYLATAGLLMGGGWREATWPVVDSPDTSG